MGGKAAGRGAYAGRIGLAVEFALGDHTDHERTRCVSVLLEFLGDVLGELVVDPMIGLGKVVFRKPRSRLSERNESPAKAVSTEGGSQQGEPRFNEHPYLPGGPE